MKYFPQEKQNTCALACIRMLLSHFEMQVPSENELSYLMQTDGTGTKVADVLLYFQRLGFCYEYLYHNEISCDKPIICLIESSKETHMVIIVLINEDRVKMYDPDAGISEQDFAALEKCRFISINR